MSFAILSVFFCSFVSLCFLVFLIETLLERAENEASQIYRKAGIVLAARQIHHL